MFLNKFVRVEVWYYSGSVKIADTAVSPSGNHGYLEI